MRVVKESSATPIPHERSSNTFAGWWCIGRWVLVSTAGLKGRPFSLGRQISVRGKVLGEAANI